ncbi:MAG: FeoB-associated Cys-rich membrane protein [Geobacteraceae bacterium]
MELKDMLIAAGILTAAFYLLYHSIWKKKGHCSGCADGGCGSGKSTAGKK